MWQFNFWKLLDCELIVESGVAHAALWFKAGYIDYATRLGRGQALLVIDHSLVLLIYL